MQRSATLEKARRLSTLVGLWRKGSNGCPPTEPGLFTKANFRAVLWGFFWGILASVLISLFFIMVFFPWYTQGHTILPGGWVSHP